MDAWQSRYVNILSQIVAEGYLYYIKSTPLYYINSIPCVSAVLTEVIFW